MSGRLPGYTIRRATIRKVGKTFVECSFTDRQGEATVECPIPHPHAGQQGGGLFFYPEVGTSVLIARAPMEKPFIVQTIPERELYFSTEGVENTSISTTPYPNNMKPGEICIKGPTGSCLNLFKKGNVSIKADIGSTSSNLEFSTLAQATFTRISNSYKFTEAGRTIEGVVKRNKSRFERQEETNTFNFLDGEAYESLLKPIGRSPGTEVNVRSTTIISEKKRNPSLVEKRSIVYEYADNFNVRALEDELSAMEQADKKNPGAGYEYLTKKRSLRHERRSDVLNLNLRNYNHLIEKVEGTLVDIYGNVVDINRNIIPVPDADTIDARNASIAKEGLQDIYRYLRRSVKFHYEINSRKEISGSEPSKSSASSNNGKNFSKFSIDIDGEGLTKINIPASSETGNIPVLGRYINSVDENDKDSGAFRDDKQIDVRMVPFAKGGPSIKNSTYKPKLDGSGTISAGTAHHDLFSTASSIFNNGKHGTGSVMSDSIDNTIGGGSPNAGGRSLHVNLDGSAEISVGSDTVDNKSMLLDMAGSLISHFGKDKEGRSLVHQSDGTALVQIGDDQTPGRLEIHLTRSGGDPQKIIIDEQGITIAVQGNAVYSSTGSTTISSKAQLILHGEIIGLYGSHDEAVDGTRAGTGFERLVLRNGNVVI